MSDEEKKVIDKLKRSANYFVMPIYETKIILELIEKQAKEIEELKKPKYIIDCETNKITKLTNNFISKDKIKEFIKEELPDDEICECCNIYDVNGIELKLKLQSLLEKE